MLAFKITINGKLITTIGQEDMSILATSLVASYGDHERSEYNRLRLSLHGLSHELPDGYCEHFRWKDQKLSVGDAIKIEIIDTAEIDLPTKRYRSDNKVQEDPFTDDEKREMRYADYLELKKEFEK